MLRRTFSRSVRTSGIDGDIGMTPRGDSHDPGKGCYFDRIAQVYDRHRSPGGPYDAVLKQMAESVGATRVLEIGAGTGNSATAFIEAYPCVPVGLELSGEMLRRARDKGIDAHWVHGDAHRIPLADGSVDFIYSVLAFHLMDDASVCLKECYRVLGKGVCSVVTAPEGFIRDHLLNRYFPSFKEIDLRRFQSEDELRRDMDAAGFCDIGFTYCEKAPVAVDAAYVDKIENRFISTLALLPEAEFRDGVRRLREDIAPAGQLEEPMVWQSVVVSGRKE